MEDKDIGTIIGIYKILSVCDVRCKDGHKLYNVECVVCGQKSKKLKSSMVGIKNCRHIIYGSEKPQIINWAWQNQRLQELFAEIKQRCYNPNSKDYRWYGAKGIEICKEWINYPPAFEVWALGNGYESGLTIDRIDPTKGYCPENCRWIPFEENARRSGKVNWITINGLTLTGKQWAKKLGVGKNLINKYIREKGLNFAINFIRNKLQDIGD